VNPYGIFESKNFIYGNGTNERFLKTKHLINSEKYDTWIMGTSRPGILDVRLLESKGSNIYNYSFFSAKNSEILELLEFFKSKPNKLPNKIVLGVEYFPFQEGYKGLDSYARKLPPEVNGGNKFKFYFNALFAKSFKDSFDHIMNDQKTKNLDFNISEGFYTLTKYNKEIEMDKDIYIDKTFSKETSEIAGLKWSEKEFKALAEINKLSIEYNIELVVFKNPIHPKQRTLFSLEMRSEWDRRVMDIRFKEYVDYSMEQSIINNNDNWYDTRHYLPEIAVKIINPLI
jgi:hypothetical protein